MPLADTRSSQSVETSGPDLNLAAAAVARFNGRHPYLLFGTRAIARIRERANNHPKLMARLHASLSDSGHALADQEPRTRIKRQGRQLIHLSFLSLIGEGRVKADALQATRFLLAQLGGAASWRARPVISSFLDCAETAVAVSLAYDWLYDALSDDEREVIEDALNRHILAPARAAYDDRFAVWPRRRDNCTLVSNAGILIAALAVIARYKEVSQHLIRKSLASTWHIFGSLAPDGAWPEGPSYWSLTMRYASLMVAALESTLAGSFGLADRPGFAKTGDFALHAVGPFGAAFNFGDSELRLDAAPLAWFAHRFRRRIDARLVDQYDGWYLPFTMIWPSRVNRAPSGIKVPTGKVFYSTNLACLRNTWSSDPAAHPVYLAIKGGNVSGPGGRPRPRPEDVFLHSQADAGSFILDGARRRWIIDLGPDDYDLPGYFDHGLDNRSGPRWRYYRAKTAGHNTLVIDGRNQIPDAYAPIVGHCVNGNPKWAVLDLSAAYGQPAGSVRRGAVLIGRQVVIQDEISAEISGPIMWVVHTCAEPVSVAGSTARLSLGGDRFIARILEPAEARFEIEFPPEPEVFAVTDVRQLHGGPRLEGDVARVAELPRRIDDESGRATGALIRRLQIRWPEGTRRLSVAFLPDCDDEVPALPVTPLDDWLARRPVRLTSVSRRFPRFGATKRAARRALRGPAPLQMRPPSVSVAATAALR